MKRSLIAGAYCTATMRTLARYSQFYRTFRMVFGCERRAVARMHVSIFERHGVSEVENCTLAFSKPLFHTAE